ncbi:MAG: MBL fold metallo-hydrolase [Candidatus Thermoplasmatota archaeon]
MKVKILYDNEAKRPLKSDWGFSAFIEGEEKILFDTGNDGDILESNMQKMDVDPSKIDKVVLSHEHHDHTGGLFSIIDESMEVFVPQSFARGLKKKVKKEAYLVEVSSRQKISSDILTTGEIRASVKEQSLLIKYDDGYILFTGCAHPGVTSIIREASRYWKIEGVMGGFHGFKDLDALKHMFPILPCHCTKYKDEIKDRYPDKTLECFAGLELDIGGE